MTTSPEARRVANFAHQLHLDKLAEQAVLDSAVAFIKSYKLPRIEDVQADVRNANLKGI